MTSPNNRWYQHFFNFNLLLKRLVLLELKFSSSNWPPPLTAPTSKKLPSKSPALSGLRLVAFERNIKRRCSMKKSILKSFAKLTGKHMCLILIFIKVAGWVAGILSKMRLRQGYFLWILRNIWEHLFHRALLGYWFNCYYLKTPNFLVFLSFFQLYLCFLLILVNFVFFFFALLIMWFRSYKYILTLTQFVIKFADWSSRQLVLYLESTSWRKREKKRENPSECLPMVYGKPKLTVLWLRLLQNLFHNKIRIFLNYSDTSYLLTSYELLKCQGINQLFK